MRVVFGAALVLLLVASFIAALITPKREKNGQTFLTWTVDDNECRQEQVLLFETQHPEIDIGIDASNMDSSKVIVQSIAGVGPDLFCCYSGTTLSAYVKAGVAWDVTDELKQRGVDVDGGLWNGADPCYREDGRIYGFPNNCCVDALWVNRDLLSENNITLPNSPMTWDEFIPLAQKLTRKDASGHPLYFGFMFGWGQWRHFMTQWGGRVYSADGTRCEIDCPETIAAVQFMHDLIYKYGVAPRPEQELDMATAGGWGSGNITWFGGQRAATALGGRWWLLLLRKYERLRLDVLESPHGPQRRYAAYGKATLINKNSPHRQAALKFLTFMNSQSYNSLILRQGDGLGPVKAFAQGDEFLHDSLHPEETYNAVWRDVMALGVPEEPSPFVNGSVVARIIGEQLDLVKCDQKSAADALHSAAMQINAEIDKTLSRDPELRVRHQALVSSRIHR
jgi:ABC-type glycerol-3-phosphate transport system substrate-binding protein